MYKKEWYDKILNVSGAFEDLVADASKQEFDVDNAFEKYYDVGKIMYAISRYENHEVNDCYLAYWANDYNWIINGGFKDSQRQSPITFSDWIVCEISDWLDSLSFFDDVKEVVQLDDYKKVFVALDKIYRNQDEWNRIFASEYDRDDEESPVVVMAYNDKTKEIVKMTDFLNWQSNKIEIEQVKWHELEKKVKLLKKQGYKEL